MFAAIDVFAVQPNDTLPRSFVVGKGRNIMGFSPIGHHAATHFLRRLRKRSGKIGRTAGCPPGSQLLRSARLTRIFRRSSLPMTSSRTLTLITCYIEFLSFARVRRGNYAAAEISGFTEGHSVNFRSRTHRFCAATPAGCRASKPTTTTVHAPISRSLRPAAIACF